MHAGDRRRNEMMFYHRCHQGIERKQRKPIEIKSFLLTRLWFPGRAREQYHVTDCRSRLNAEFWSELSRPPRGDRAATALRAGGAMDPFERTDAQFVPNVIPDRVRLPFSFDTALLVEDLARLGENWTPHYVPQNYSGNWSVIPLRAPSGETHPIRMIYSDPTARTYVDTEALRACPYFREVLSSFQTTLLAARVMRLTAGSTIKEHTDLDLRFEEGRVRIHIPIVSNPDVEFYLNNERVVLAAGSCWYLRLSDPHRVANRGTTDRVHLVIDLEVNEWLTELFRSETLVQRRGGH
jgi:hypothetical protein